MSHAIHESKSEFMLQGQFISFAAKEGYKLKYLRLATPDGEQWIKLPKELRGDLYRSLVPGAWIQVYGSRKVCSKKGTITLKAYQVSPVAGEINPGMNPMPFTPAIEPASQPAAKTECILVCQKSDCCKRGAKALVAALQNELDDRGLADQVKIKPTGCMKRCKTGPHLVMPDKTRYCQIQAKEIPAIVDKHFVATDVAPALVGAKS
ncbi:MAG TPA: (2Fe-2S) ferredoxin domain-containing protein [Allocoleopsis sp.]